MKILTIATQQVLQILLVLDDTIADIMSNKKFQAL